MEFYPHVPLRLHYTFLGSTGLYPTNREFELNYTSELQVLAGYQKLRLSSVSDRRMVDRGDWSIYGMVPTGRTGVLEEKPVPVRSCTKQISNVLAWNGTCSFAVRDLKSSKYSSLN